MEITVKPTIDPELIPLEKGGFMLFITNLETEIEYERDTDDSGRVGFIGVLKRKLRQVLCPNEGE